MGPTKGTDQWREQRACQMILLAIVVMFGLIPVWREGRVWIVPFVAGSITIGGLVGSYWRRHRLASRHEARVVALVSTGVLLLFSIAGAGATWEIAAISVVASGMALAGSVADLRLSTQFCTACRYWSETAEWSACDSAGSSSSDLEQHVHSHDFEYLGQMRSPSDPEESRYVFTLTFCRCEAVQVLHVDRAISFDDGYKLTSVVEALKLTLEQCKGLKELYAPARR
jgi:hypothetical protein